MSRSYKLLVEASKPYTKQELLMQAELRDFFTDVDFGDCQQVKTSDGKEYISWIGETSLGGGRSEQEEHERIKEFLQEVSESQDVKVRTHWLNLDHFDEEIGDEL